MGDELNSLKALFDEKILRILDVLVNNETEFYLRELAAKANVPPATTHRIIQRLLELKIIEKTEIKNLKIYKLSTTKQGDAIRKMLYSKPDPLDIFIQQIRMVPEVKRVVMHAKPQTNSAFLLVVGDTLPIIQINGIADEIEKKYSYKIKILPLQYDQYEMLNATHSGYKKILIDDK